MDTTVEIVKALLLELKPGHSYILGLNSQQVRRDDMVRLAEVLDEEGFGGVTIMSFHGDPSTGMIAVEKEDDGTTKPV